MICSLRCAVLHNAFVILLWSIVAVSATLPALAQTVDSVIEAHETALPEASWNSVANAGAIVVLGHARFTVLTSQLVRMEWAADGKFEDRPSFVFLNRRLPVPKFDVKREDERITLDTGSLRVTYDGSGQDNGRFTSRNLAVSFLLAGKEVNWHPGMSDPGNLQGTTRTLDGALGDKVKEPIEDGLISRSGWSLVDDSSRPLFDSDNFAFSDGEKSPWPWVTIHPSDGHQDWYFFGYGHDYKKALFDYVRVAGRIPLPPRFAFGAWWSRYWAYSDQELDNLIASFHINDVPLDVLVVDMDWHLNQTQLAAMNEKDQSGHNLGWTGYTWNPLLFPNPDEFVQHVHDEGLRVTLNLHPASGIEPWEKAYPAMATAMGTNPDSKKYVPFDITDKKFATNYMNLVHHPLERQGIDFWWLDWQQGGKTNIPTVNPTWWLNYVHFTDQQREGKRPLLFHRWGGLGNHRYEIGFSGDTISAWSSLAFQPWFTATAANVGYAYWSHDIGGHIPGIVDPELYTRWIQFGAFSPILRTHTTKNPDAERRVWVYPEPYSSIMRSTFQERYALQPYLYTEGRRTYDTGVAFLHPLYYDWPEADAAYNHKNEYAFGSEMIVAPIASPVDSTTQLATTSVWIPNGEWIERPSGRHFIGPTEKTRSFSVDQVPVYVPAGAIIPRQTAMQYTGQKPVDPLTLQIYPLSDGQSSKFTMYADGSESEAYKRGVCSWTKLRATQHGDVFTVEIAPVDGSFPGMITERAYQVELVGDWPPKSVSVNGIPIKYTGQHAAKIGWRYDGNTLTTIITTPRYSVHSRVRLDITRSPGSLASRSLLDGFAGSIGRLHGAYDSLNALWNAAWSPNVLIDAWQTGDRITYQPQTARQEIDRFPRVYEESLAAVQVLTDAAIASARLPAEKPESETDQKKTASRRVDLQRAAALLEDGRP